MDVGRWSSVQCFIYIRIVVKPLSEAAKPDIKLDGDTLEVVDEYKYLGSMIINGYTREIRRRLQQARCAFKKRKGLFTSRNIDIKIRKILLKVWSEALYGTWTVRNAEENVCI